MSLINKMLQDLEQRQGASAHDEAIAGQIRSAPKVRQWRAGVLTAIGLFAFGGGAAAWMLMQTKPALPVLASAPPVLAATPFAAPAAAPVAVPDVVPAAVPVVVPAAVPVVAPVAAPVAAPAPAPPVALAAKRSPVPDVTIAMAVAKAPHVMRDKAPDAAPAKPVAAKSAAPEKPSPVVAPREEDVKSVSTAVAAVKNPPRAVVEEAPGAERLQGRTAAAAQGSSQKTVSPQQASDNLYRQAVVLVQQGRGGEARDTLRKSLDANPRNVESLQLLVGLLVESNNIDAALPLLREGLKLLPEQSGLSMNLARLQMDRGDTSGAMATLEQGLPMVRDDPQYRAFYATLLQRAGRHDEAVQQYLSALQSDPAMPNWLVGIGISLHAVGKDVDAAQAFQRAKDGGRLASSLAEFVDQRLSQLGR